MVIPVAIAIVMIVVIAANDEVRTVIMFRREYGNAAQAVRLAHRTASSG